MPLLNNIYFISKKKNGVGYKKLYQTLTSSGGEKKKRRKKREKTNV